MEKSVIPGQEQNRAQAEEVEGRSTVGAGTDGAQTGRSSRDSLAKAGWRCWRPGSFKGLVSYESRPFSWLALAPVWQSRNQVLGDLFGDPTNEERRRWMEVQRKTGRLPEKPAVEDLVIKKHADLEEVSFFMLGDPGEGDASQYALVPPLETEERRESTHFMVICSDVIYPAGGIDQYEDKFYRPYRDYPCPVYAVPGNHDWYDGLTGFMYHLCGWDGRTLPEQPRASRWRGRVRDVLWRRPPEKEDPTAGARREVWRSGSGQRSSQRTPYFAIETGPLLIVGIDTGMSGDIDQEQGSWLREVSRIDKPKLLLTGKPIYVDGKYHPGAVEGGGTVDEIVRDPEHNYVAVIGGDIHNYQRYPVRLGDGRKIEYIVSGGAGAYMSATHTIPYIRLSGVDEKDFRCYPRRGDSLSFYSKLYDRRFGLGKGWFEIPPDEAAAYMMDLLLGITGKDRETMDLEDLEERIGRIREGDKYTYVTRRTQRIARRMIYPPPGYRRGPLHHFFSEFFDWNDPPLFKNFLRIDASASEVRIRCFAATGCLEHEKDPPVEDDVRIQLTTSGT
ncbi:MAG TPA: metallophosphoesterase [Rubrobacteraceae bacterium]|nr:metallophosphoesterase [Rubrobacteraceae bacterium]